MFDEISPKPRCRSCNSHCESQPHGLLMHVGIDSTNAGVSAPLLNSRGEFKFIHIPEIRDSKEVETFRSLGVLDYLPTNYTWTKQIRYEDKQPHYDPDLKNFTYSEPKTKTQHIRGDQLSKLREKTDFLFFVASLCPYSEDMYRKDADGIRRLSSIRLNQRGRMAKFVVGYYRVQTIWSSRATDWDIPESEIGRQLQKNAHLKYDIPEHFVCAIGMKDRESLLLQRAMKLTKDGSPFLPDVLGLKVYGDKKFHMGFKWLCPNDSNLHHLVGLCETQQS